MAVTNTYTGLNDLSQYEHTDNAITLLLHKVMPSSSFQSLDTITHSKIIIELSK